MTSPSTEDTRWYSHRRYLYVLAKALLVCLALYVVWRVLAVAGTVLKPVIISLVIAYLLDPLIDAFEKRRVRRSIAILFVATVLLLGIAVLLLLVLPTFIEQFRLTMTRLPEWFDVTYGRFKELAETRLGYSTEELDLAVKRAFSSVQAAALQVLSNLGNSVEAALNALLIPLFVFYFLRDFDVLKKRPLELVPPRFHDYVIQRARTMDRVVGGWVRGQVEVALVLAALYAIGLTLAGVRLGAVIGIVAGLLNVVPYFGAAIGIVLSVLMILIEHEGVRGLVGVGLVFVIVQLLEGYVITPRLVGQKVGMSPVTVIVVLLVGGSLLGLFGLLLAVPVTAALTVLVQDVLAWYRRTPLYTGEAS